MDTTTGKNRRRGGVAMADAVVRGFFPNPACVLQARSWARSKFDLWFGGVDSDEFTLIVGQMVSKALQRPKGMISLYLRREGGQIVVAVSDSGRGGVVPRKANITSQDGRDLVVVGALSEGWSVNQDSGHANTVWAQLAVD